MIRFHAWGAECALHRRVSPLDPVPGACPHGTGGTQPPRVDGRNEKGRCGPGLKAVLRNSCLAMIAWLVLGALNPALAVTVSVSPLSQTVTAGDAVPLAINISGLGNGTALSAFDLNINYDPALLGFQFASFGDPALGDQLDLQNFGLNDPLATAGTGTVNLIETDLADLPPDLLSNQAGNFTLATLTFTSLASGFTPVTLTINSLADQNAAPISALSGFGSVTIQASVVPLPASSYLLLSGLAGMGLFGRRVTRRSSACPWSPQGRGRTGSHCTG